MKYFQSILLLTLSICRFVDSTKPKDTLSRPLLSSPIKSFPESDDEPASVMVIERILRLFSSDMMHSYNLILYGGIGGSAQGIQNYIAQHNENDYSEIIISTITNISNGTNEVFKSVIDSYLQIFHTDHKPVFLIHPDSLEEAQTILHEINAFYEMAPSKSSATYFFLYWPWPTSWQTGVKLNGENDGKSISDIVKNIVLTAPMHSNFYILSSEMVNYRENGDLSWPWLEQDMSDLTIREFFYISTRFIFEPVVLSEHEFLHHFQRRRDFRGATVKALLVEESKTSKPKMTTLTSAIHVSSFFKPVSKILNFKIKYLVGTGLITQLPNGSLKGMGKQLLDKEADLVLSLFELLEFRLQHLAPSHSVISNEVNAYFQQPPPALYRNILIEAFSSGLWALILATWVVIVGCLLFFTSIKKKYCPDNCFEEDEMIAYEAVYWAIGAACQTGWSYTPKSASLQIIFICGLISGFVYYTAYSASIISIFSVELNRFKKLSDLLDHGFKLYADGNTYTGQYYIQVQAQEVGDTLESRIIDASTALRKIQESRVAYVISREWFFYKAVEVDNVNQECFCKFLSKLPRYVDRQYNAWYFRKFSPLKKYINTQLTFWTERGLIFRTNMNIQRSFPSPCDPKKKQAVALGIADVRSAFLVLAFGYICSVSILIAEKMFANFSIGTKTLSFGIIKFVMTNISCEEPK